MKLRTESSVEQNPKAHYENILSGYPVKNEDTLADTLAFFESFPDLPSDPREAFLAIRKHLIDQGFQYDGHTFLLEDIIREKRANCLGFCVLFGIILEGKGFDVDYEVAVNAEDGHYKYDLKKFDELIHGDVFSYDNLPDLPNEKEQTPQNRFVSLQHPLLNVGGVSYETTDLPNPDAPEDSDDSMSPSFEHGYKSETRQPVTLKNLYGSLFISQAKVLLSSPSNSIQDITSIARQGLGLWPEDTQGWVFLRDLSIEQFDDETAEVAERRFREMAEDNSLYNFSLYNITADEKILDKAIEQYPAFMEAYLIKHLKPPFKTEAEKREARFLYTVGAQCVANSAEMDLVDFYTRHLEGITEAFGLDEAKDLLYDMAFDENEGTEYQLAMYRVTHDPSFLVEAVENGELENSTPRNLLHFCHTVIRETADGDSIEAKKARASCAQVLEGLRSKYKDSKLYQRELKLAA